MTASIDWEKVARSRLSDMAARVLEVAATRPVEGDPGWSAKSLSREIDRPLNLVAYHVRQLAEKGLLVKVGEREASRGAVFETFYRVAS